MERRGQLESQLARVSGWKLRTLTPELIAAAVPEGTALVDLFRYTRYRLDPAPLATRSEPQYVAFVVRHGADPHRIELGPAAQIDSALTGGASSSRRATHRPMQPGLSWPDSSGPRWPRRSERCQP